MFKVKLIDTFLGALIGTALFFPFLAVLDRKPDPYSNVEYSVTPNDSGYLINASFEKNACVFEDLVILGTRLGYTKPIYWYDTEENKGNREVGKHNFTLQAVTREELVSIKVVTQHTCSGELVENVFLEEDL